MNSIDRSSIIRRTEQTVLKYCAEKNLFLPGARVIVACSGGADSMALLRLLLRCRSELDIEVSATHVDHGIRGAASRSDAAFVRDFCERNGVPFTLYEAARETAVPEHPSEDWARRLRYRWFDELASREHACIVTAHTLSDQTETVLFRLARGTGVHGLAGIRPVRDVYRRPFLCLTRAQTEAYCQALGQDYVQDESNLSDVYARNRIRHDAVPALEYASPGAEQAIGRLCSQMEELDRWLSRQAKSLLQCAACPDGSYDLAVLRQADGPILTAALHRLVSPVRDAEQKYIALLRTAILKGQGAVQLAPEVIWQANHGRLRCAAPRPSQLSAAPPQPVRDGEYAFAGGFTLEIETVNYEDFIKNTSFFKKDYTSYADYAKMGKNILIRTRQPGDEFRPAGRHVRKTLKKYFNETAVPTQDRALLPLIAEGSRVLWLWGSGFAEGLAPEPSTRQVLVIRWGREPATEE